MTSRDVTHLHLTDFFPNFQDVFPLLIRSYGVNIKSFGQLTGKLLTKMCFQAQYGKYRGKSISSLQMPIKNELLVQIP